MGKGDVVCFWLHVNHEKRDKLRRENRMSRRHIVDTKSGELTRKTSNFVVNLYGSDKKIVGDKTGTCPDSRHCSSNIVKPSSPAAGLALCIETALASGQKASIVVVHGTTPVPATSGKLAAVGCEARTAELEAADKK
jgi:hypothetical protein